MIKLSCPIPHDQIVSVVSIVLSKNGAPAGYPAVNARPPRPKLREEGVYEPRDTSVGDLEAVITEPKNKANGINVRLFFTLEHDYVGVCSRVLCDILLPPLRMAPWPGRRCVQRPSKRSAARYWSVQQQILENFIFSSAMSHSFTRCLSRLL